MIDWHFLQSNHKMYEKDWLYSRISRMIKIQKEVFFNHFGFLFFTDYFCKSKCKDGKQNASKNSICIIFSRKILMTLNHDRMNEIDPLLVTKFGNKFKERKQNEPVTSNACHKFPSWGQILFIFTFRHKIYK